MRVKSIFVVVLLSILTIETYVIIRQAKTIETIKKEMPLLIIGERIDYFDLMGVEGNAIDNSFLKRSPYSLVFIFERPCSKCNKNIAYWKKVKSLVKDRIPVYGIVLDNYDKMVDFDHSGGLNFNLYAPVDKEKFLEKLRVKLNFAQTIILKKDRVGFVKIGNLSQTDFLAIIKLLKKRKLEQK